MTDTSVPVPILALDDVKVLMAPYMTAVDVLVGMGKSLEVVDAQSNALAINTILETRTLWEAVEGVRVGLVASPRAYIAGVAELAHGFQDPLKDLMADLKAKTSAYADLSGTEKVKTQDGSAHQQLDWLYEVEDLEKVDRSWLMLNDKGVKAAIKAGVRNIPGLRIYPKTKVIARRK